MLRSGDPHALRTAHPDTIRHLQRSVGNAGVASALAQPGRTQLRAPLARSVRQRGPVLARALSTTDAFSAALGKHNKDKTLEQIVALLKRWHELDGAKVAAAAAPGHQNPTEDNDFDRIATAKLIQFETDRWIDGHPEQLAVDRGKAVLKLHDDARLEAVQLEQAAGTRYGTTALGTAAERIKAHVEKKSAAVTAKDMHSAFDRLGAIIEGAVPALGSKAEVEGELEFAVDPSMIGFVGLRIKLEADRPETTRCKTRAELTFTAGAKLPNLGRVRFEMGGYVEVQGKTGVEAARLISYSIYRTARRHREIPRWFVNKLWGGEWESPGYANAERWAGAVESGVLKGNAFGYAEAGLMVGGMAEVGVQAGDVAAKAKANVQTGVGERWDAAAITGVQETKAAKKGLILLSDAAVDDIGLFMSSDMTAARLQLVLERLNHGKLSRDSCEEILKRTRHLEPSDAHYRDDVKAAVRKASPGYRPGLGEASKEEALFGRQKGRGERTFWVKGQAEADISPVGKMAMKYERHWQTRGRDKNRATHWREHKLEGRFGFSLPLGKTLGADLLTVLAMQKVVTALVAFSRSSTQDKELAKQEAKSRKVGVATRTGADVATIVTQLLHLPTKDFAWAGEAKSAIDPGIFGSVTLFVIIDVKAAAAPQPAPGKAAGVNPWEINIQIAEERAFKFEADLAAVAGRFAAKTQERIFRAQLRHNTTNWQTDFAGDVGGGEVIDDAKDHKRAPWKKKKQQPAAPAATGTG